MARKIVHVVGTGTIGEPLIGLLCDFKDDLGIDEITFHKNTPLPSDKTKVKNCLILVPPNVSKLGESIFCKMT